MFVARLAIGLFEFGLTAVLAVLVVYVNYRLFIVTNPDYDGEEELKKGNTATAVLTGGLLVSSGLIVRQAIYPVVTLVRLHFTTPEGNVLPTWQLALLAVGHLLLAFGVAVLAMSGGLRLYGRLTRGVHFGEELARGNTAAGVVLAAVVFVIATFVSDGVGSLTTALLPSPSIGIVQMME